LIIATSNQFETKEIKVYLEIDEIPESLLSFDLTGFEEITAYEGETVQIAASFVDEFHNIDIIFDNPSEGNVTWSIYGTSASSEHIMDKIIHTYVDYINLPYYNITGGRDYNITITGTAARDYAIKKQNITLHVLKKIATNLIIYNYTDEDVRIGKPLYIYSNLTFTNGTSLAYKIINFNMTYLNDSLIIDQITSTLLTDENGVATYYISEIPDGVNKIIVNASYEGTEKIAPVSSSLIVNVLGKHLTILQLTEEYEVDIRVGKSISFIANLTSIDFGPMNDTTIIFNITSNYGTYIVTREYPEVTNKNGTYKYTIDVINDGVKKIIVEIRYEGSKIFAPCFIRKSYDINPKYNATLNIMSSLPEEIMVGSNLYVSANLINNNTKSPIENATVIFELHFDDPNVDPIIETRRTDQNGIATAVIEIPTTVSSANSFTIILKYEGDLSIESTQTQLQTSISILTPMKLFLRYLPYILITLAIIAVSLLVYQYGIRVPRIKRKIRRMKEISQKFTDILNMQHLLVLSKTGATIYSHSFQERTFDPDLISGFLTAIASFQKSSQIKKVSSEELEGGFELSYANFIILVKEGKYAQVALILDQKPSETIRIALNKFVQIFESKYESELKHFSGYLKPFADTGKLIDEIFESSLVWPHIVSPDLPEDIDKQLTGLESSIMTIALTIQRERNYFMVPTLIEAVKEVRKISTEEILAVFDDLRKKNVFKAFHPDKLEEIIEEVKEQQQIKEITSTLSTEEIIPPIKEVPKKDLKTINNHLLKTSFIFQQKVLKEFYDLPKKDAPKFVKEYITKWNNLDNQRTLLLEKYDEFMNNNEKYQAILVLEDIKRTYEEAGLDDEADKIANKIQELIIKLKDENPEQFNELIKNRTRTC